MVIARLMIIGSEGLGGKWTGPPQIWWTRKPASLISPERACLMVSIRQYAPEVILRFERIRARVAMTRLAITSRYREVPLRGWDVQSLVEGCRILF